MKKNQELSKEELYQEITELKTCINELHGKAVKEDCIEILENYSSSLNNELSSKLKQVNPSFLQVILNKLLTSDFKNLEDKDYLEITKTIVNEAKNKNFYPKIHKLYCSTPISTVNYLIENLSIKKDIYNKYYRNQKDNLAHRLLENNPSIYGGDEITFFMKTLGFNLFLNVVIPIAISSPYAIIGTLPLGIILSRKFIKKRNSIIDNYTSEKGLLPYKENIKLQ